MSDVIEVPLEFGSRSQSLLGEREMTRDDLRETPGSGRSGMSAEKRRGHRSTPRVHEPVQVATRNCDSASTAFVFLDPEEAHDMLDDAFTAIARDGAGVIEVAARLQKALR